MHIKEPALMLTGQSNVKPKYSMNMKNVKSLKILVLAFFLAGSAAMGSDISVGIARTDITPPLPFWLTGYTRNSKSSQVVQRLWAKALVFEESPKSRVVIVTTDILGLSHEITEAVSKRINRKYGITRAQLLMNSSHTHSGPLIWPNLSMTFNLSPEDLREVSQYSQKLTDDLVAIIDTAMANRTPMKISSGHGSAGFAVNRREFTDKGVIIGVNRNGPVDHDVPVIKISSNDGKLKAILFGYTCHNTTSGTNLINGDYSGFAQAELEKAYPGVTAMYMIGCGADQNPNPRGSIEIAGQYGKQLAQAVQKVLEGNLNPVRPPIRTDYIAVNLDFRPFDPELYEKDILSKNPDVQRRANLMLEAYNKGWDVSHYPYPVQVVRFNNDLTILSLSGEVVVDYSLRAKKEYPGENMFVSGYCSEVTCYIPSKRVLNEGGYEADRSMTGYGFPGPFADNVEEKIFSAIHTIMRNTGAKMK
jgi:neutral ceramidase